MTPDTRNAIIALAREEAGPDYERFRLKVTVSGFAHDRFIRGPLNHNLGCLELFKAAYRQDMARRWLDETTRRLEEMKHGTD